MYDGAAVLPVLLPSTVLAAAFNNVNTPVPEGVEESTVPSPVTDVTPLLGGAIQVGALVPVLYPNTQPLLVVGANEVTKVPLPYNILPAVTDKLALEVPPLAIATGDVNDPVLDPVPDKPVPAELNTVAGFCVNCVYVKASLPIVMTCDVRNQEVFVLTVPFATGIAPVLFM